MKKLTWIICFVSSSVLAQQNRDVIESLPGVQTADFGERLVELAWRNNPEAEAAEHTIEAEEQDINIANAQWLDIVTFQGNLNEFNIDESQDQFGRADFYPRYNVGARVNMGMFLSIPAQVRRSKQEVMIAKAQADGIKHSLRTRVLQVYHNFLMYDKIYSLQSELLISSESTQSLNEEKFTSGEISFEEYNAAKGAFNQQQIAFLQAETNFKNAKVQLEELIGMTLEEVVE